MNGSVTGNIIATIYFLIFQFAGILLAHKFLKKENVFARIILGSTTGSVLFQWIPILLSFIFKFSITAHVLALIPLAIIIGICIKDLVKNKEAIFDKKQFSASIKEHLGFCIFFIITFIGWIYLLDTHTIKAFPDGSLHSGQSTYGDMNMHLGFITSIAMQQNMPAEYSIFPGTKLAYPFLSDSISSSLYVLGASLKYAYILPMYAAFLQVAGAVYLLAYTVLRSKIKAILAWCLYFFNGGLGLIYFFGLDEEYPYKFSDIFTGFYNTPTNLVNQNIRWVNVITDILIPQRASLFGYAVAFPCIYLLYKAVFKENEAKKNYFIYTGILMGSLPLIHTHSFMALGLISASWLLYRLYESNQENKKLQPLHLFVTFIIFMCSISGLLQNKIITKESLMPIAIVIISAIVIYGILLLIKEFKKNGPKEFLNTWGAFLLFALVLAIPQLIFWTFGQVSDGGFVRGHFNWGNLKDEYIWFYLKNLGLPFIFIIGSILKNNNKHSMLFLPAGIIWFLAELIVFTPNTYDNNKLLYIAYLLLIIPAADFAVDKLQTIKKKYVSIPCAIIILAICFIAGILTLCREFISDMQLYQPSAVKLAEYVETNTAVDSIFLTDSRHNNEIASLTGRSIVCGSGSFLFYHGINTTERNQDVKNMFESPYYNSALFEKYNVDYVVISPYEDRNYVIDKSWFDSNCSLVFQENNFYLYKVK